MISNMPLLKCSSCGKEVMRNGDRKKITCEGCQKVKNINRLWSKRIEKKHTMICKKADKIIYDKKTAITMKNLTFKLHHIKMAEYPCGDHWHLATKPENGHKRPFRHNLS